MKTAPLEKSLFEADPLDEALDLITAMKSDLKDIETYFKLRRQASLEEVKTRLLELKETITSFEQPGLFAESGAGLSDDFGQLTELIGADAARKIAEVFSGTTIYVPKNIVVNQNYLAIRKEYKDGASYRELAVRYGYTQRYIRQIIHRKRGQKNS